jgi:hypothetical protein
MANKRNGGLHGFTVQEAQNASLGQAGVAFLSDTSTYTPPGNTIVIAIQFVEDTLFDSSDATTADENWPTDAQGGLGTNSDAINQKTMPSGMTIFGRWKTVAFDSGSAFLYLGA